MQKYLVLESQL